MSKKIPFSIMLIAAFCNLSFYLSSAHAENLTDGEENFWSFNEIKEFYHQADLEKDLICGSDPICKSDLGYEWAAKDPKYEAVLSFSSNNFFITAINPTENYVRAYYRDIDTMSLEMSGIEIHNPLSEAYIAWLDSNFGEQDFTFVNYMREGIPHDGMHEIYRANTDLNGADWFPVEVEVELSAPESHLELNDNGNLLFFALSDSFSTLGWLNFSSCINSPDYQPGMECRLVYHKDNGRRTYSPFPKEVTVVAPPQETTIDDFSPNDKLQEAIISLASNNNASEIAIIPTIPLDKNEKIDLSTSLSREDASKEVALATEGPSLNETIQTVTPLSAAIEEIGVPSSREKCSNEVYFPWWFIILLVVGDILVLWLLSPNRRDIKKSENVAKKS